MRIVIAALILLIELGATSAPGDEYFGRLKMSALRIRYETMQLKKRYESHELLPDQTLHLLLLTQDAFDDWARRYPDDAWLPSTGYLLAQLYEELPGRLARDRAVALLVYVKSQFPQTSYARKSRDQLHRGVWTKPVPDWARATPAPTATPSPSATPYRRARRTALRECSVTSGRSSELA
jgi:hypothetical protein